MRVVRNWLLVSAALLAGVVTARGASADTTGNPDTTTQAAIHPATPSINAPGTINNVAEGTRIDIHIQGTAGKLFSADARLCKAGLTVQTASQMDPGSFGNCLVKPFVGTDQDDPARTDDSFASASSDSSNTTVDLSFRVGAGTESFTADNGPSTITCDAANPCALWIEESVDTSVKASGALYKHYDLHYTAVPAYTPVTPTRLLDTRAGQPALDPQKGALGADGSYDITVAAAGKPAPVGATAVVMNVTAVGPSANGYLMLFPTGHRPASDTSNLNFTAGQAAVPNLVVAPVGDNGKVTVFNKFGTTDVLFDVMGYFPAGSLYSPTTPSRLLDTRAGQPASDPQKGALGADGSYDITVAGASRPAPAGAVAVVMNVTAVGPSANGYLMVFPTGHRPASDTSNLNFTAGQAAVPNLVIAPVGDNGKVTVFNKFGTTDVLFDVMGYFPAGTTYAPVTPLRLLDTRAGQPASDPQKGALGPDGSYHITVSGAGKPAPAGATAVVLNVTAVNPSANGYLMLFPTGNRPATDTSNVNFAAGQAAVPNLVIAPIGANGQIDVFNKFGTTDVIFDVMGYFPS